MDFVKSDIVAWIHRERIGVDILSLWHALKYIREDLKIWRVILELFRTSVSASYLAY